MTLREAAQQALSALRTCPRETREVWKDGIDIDVPSPSTKYRDDAIEALQQALAQPESEPKGTHKASAPVKLTVTLQDTEGDRYKRMFEAACVCIGDIGDALGCDPNEGGSEAILDAIEALRAQQVAVPQEPVAYIHKDQLAFLRTMHGDESAQARYANGFTSWLPDSVRAEFIPLYAAPQPAYVPLSDAEIASATRQELDELMDFIYEYGTAANGVSRRVVALTRAIEQAVRGKT